MERERLYSSTEACKAAGISYRQLDYWARLGLVTPVQAARGSGSQRRFSFGNIVTLAVIDAFGCGDHDALPAGIEELVADGAPLIASSTTADHGVRRRARGLVNAELIVTLVNETHGKALIVVDVDAIRDNLEARLTTSAAA